MFLKSGPSLLYIFKKWSEFTLKVVRVYLKSGPSLPGPNLPGPSLLVFLKTTDYNRLFLHNYLSPENIRRKHIYFHAIKANLIKGYKCSLNLKTNTYELR